MKKLILTSAFLAACGPFLQAAIVIDFESPYTTGALSLGSNLSTNAPFTGQQGWSSSASNGAGSITTTTTSGSYTGSQALTGGATTYIGANAVGGFDSFTFDFLYVGGYEVYVGGWNDDNDADSLFDAAEIEFAAGAMYNTPTTCYFGIRYATGSKISTGTGGTSGHWYRMTVTTEYDATPTVTLGVYNLTTSTAVTLGTSSFNLTTAQFGVDPTTFDGVVARVTGVSSGTAPAIDNITLIPEPSIALLGSMGLLGLLCRRR